MLKLASSALALALMASPAFAQTAPRDWTGPYIGIFGGYNESRGEADERLLFDRNLDGTFGESVVTGGGLDAFAPGFCEGSARSQLAADGCADDNDGVEAGVRAGYDWQVGSFVVGALAEYSLNNVQDSANGFSSTPASYTFTRELESTAAARVRLGYAMGPALLYGTGGYAQGKFDNRFRTTNASNTFTETSDEGEGDGWQAGAGMEYQLAGGLTFTGEYLYTSLDVESPTVRVGQGTALPSNPFILAPNTTGTDIQRSAEQFEAHHVRIGMNYRF